MVILQHPTEALAAVGDPRGGEAAFCVDYGVGKRWTERRAGKTRGFDLKLAALRLSEKVIMFDEGESRRR